MNVRLRILIFLQIQILTTVTIGIYALEDSKWKQIDCGYLSLTRKSHTIKKDYHWFSICFLNKNVIISL